MAMIKLQTLIEELIGSGIDYSKVEKVIKNMNLKSTTLTEEQAAYLRKEVGLPSESVATPPVTTSASTGLTEVPPKNLDQSAQRIDARSGLTAQSITTLELQLAAIAGQTLAEQEELARLTKSTAYEATSMQYRLAALKRQKEALMASQPNSDINSLLSELNIANPMSVCSSAIKLAEETMKEIKQLQQEKKA